MNAILDALDPEQRQVAEALNGPVLVEAGAGTGKTRAITARIAHAASSGVHDPRRGLAVTFTNRAAGEMRTRLQALDVHGMSVRTFHSAALAQLRHFWPTTVGGPFPELISSKVKLVGQACRECGVKASVPTQRDLSAEMEWAAANLITPDQYVERAGALGRSAISAGSESLDFAEVADVMSAYADIKRSAGVIDMEDVLLCLLAILGESPAAADSVRDRYRWFTVDEYQDISAAQSALLGAWLGERDDLCVVGDSSQTIYSFAGATPRSLSRFMTAWPTATRIQLVRCYRCTPQVVRAANALIHDTGHASVRLQAIRPAGGAVDIVECADDQDEAQTVAGRIADLMADGTAARDIAVLMRINAASAPLEAALDARGIPYVMRGSERFFERAEIREALVRLRAEAGVASAQTLSKDEDTHTNGREALAGVLATMGWRPTPPVGAGKERERWESLSAVVALAEDLAASGRSSLRELMRELDGRAEAAHAPAPDGVTLATLHSAKGLEWPVVFIVGCSEGSLPIVHAVGEEQLAEERRLLYVGVTRAQDVLILSWARTRSGRARRPSRFLSDLSHSGAAEARTRPTERSGAATRGNRNRGPAKCRICRAALVTPSEATIGRCRLCPASVNEPLLGRLRDWRTRRAKEDSIPAFVVFTDATLVALAEQLPADASGLLKIPGIGVAKVEKYGPTLLELIATRD